MDNKKVIIAIIIVIAIVAAFYIFNANIRSGKTPLEPPSASVPAEDLTTQEIIDSLDVEIEAIEEELQAIDSELQGL